MRRKGTILLLTVMIMAALGGCGIAAAERGDDVKETGQDAAQENAVQENENAVQENVLPEDIPSKQAQQDTPQEDGSAEQTDLQEEPEYPFDSSGDYHEILADDEEGLSEEERSAFLASFGFEDSEPFYVHTEENGHSFMELFFDEEREIGCGILYWIHDSGNVPCFGFAFSKCTSVRWREQDPFSVYSIYGTSGLFVEGTSGEERVTDYKENYEYDEEGRLLRFWSTGTPKDIEGWDDIFMIEVEFIYDDQGRLREKKYRHNSTPHLPFYSAYSYQNSYYDEDGRLKHTDSYVSHGSLEGYYIYEGDSDVPSYYLELDTFTYIPEFYRYVSR